MKKKASIASIGIAFAIAALAVCPAADGKGGKIYKPDMDNCAGFTAADVGRLLQVPAASVKSATQKVHESYWTCSFRSGDRVLGFSVAVSSTVEDAVTDMVRYRRNMEETAATDSFKDSLPGGAWSAIAGLGDEALWTDINHTLRVRRGNVIVQVMAPADKPGQIKVAEAFLKKLR